jgi:hypothetical protein
LRPRLEEDKAMSTDAIASGAQVAVERLAALWPDARRGLLQAGRLPAWSTVLTRQGLMLGLLGWYSGVLTGIGAYVIDDGTVGSGGDPSSFLGVPWRKVLGLRTPDYSRVTGDRGALVPGLGRLAAVRCGDAAAIVNARSGAVLAASAEALDSISTALALPAEALGVYGSALYKPAELRSDFDFVVYGEANAVAAHREVRRWLARGEPYMKGQVPYHLRFRLGDSGCWFDPRYWRSEPFTPALIAGRYTVLGSEDIDGVEVTDDRYGIFTPSVYGLADGTMLLSYRLGHAAYVRAGERITASRIPVFELCGATCRVILGYEDLKKD